MDALQEMTIGDVLKTAAGVLVVLSSIIQIAPVKLNPWTWLAGKIGKAVNNEVMTELKAMKDDISGVKADVESVKRDVQNVRNSIDENVAKGARAKILRFGDEVLHGAKHSKDHFDEILRDITEYDHYCDTHPEFQNQITESTKRIIIDKYDVCMREHSFL